MKKLKITFNSPVVLGYLTAGMTNELLFMTYHSALTNPMTYVRLFTHT